MSAKIPFKYAILPALMSDHQSELCASYVPRERHELFSRRELVEVWAREIVWPLCGWEGLLYKAFRNALRSGEGLSVMVRQLRGIAKDHVLSGLTVCVCVCKGHCFC